MENIDIIKLVNTGLKALSKEFKVNDFDTNGNMTDSKTLTLSQILVMLQVIPTDKFEINIIQVKE